MSLAVRGAAGGGRARRRASRRHGRGGRTRRCRTSPERKGRLSRGLGFEGKISLSCLEAPRAPLEARRRARGGGAAIRTDVLLLGRFDDSGRDDMRDECAAPSPTLRRGGVVRAARRAARW